MQAHSHSRKRPPVRTARSEFAEKLINYIVRYGPLAHQDLWRYVGNRYSTRVVMNILTRGIEAGLIVKTADGYSGSRG
jgi:hypothetical protein